MAGKPEDNPIIVMTREELAERLAEARESGYEDGWFDCSEYNSI